MNPSSQAFRSFGVGVLVSLGTLLILGLKLESLRAIKPPETGMKALHPQARNTTLAQSSPPAEMASTLSGVFLQLGDGAAREFVLKLKTADFPALLLEAADVSDPEKRARLLNLIFSVWSERNPAEAIGYAVHYSADEVQLVLRQWARNEPSGAWNWVATDVPMSSLLLGKSQIDYYDQITGALLTDGRTAEAEALTDSLTIDGMKMMVTSKYLRRMAAADPEAAIAWLKDRTFPDKGAADSAARNFGMGIASRGVDDTAHLLDRITDDNQRRLIIAGATIQWSGERDLSSLSKLTDHLNLSSPSDADAMLSTLGTVMQLSDPVLAFSTFSKITDAAIRDPALDNLSARVIKTDPALAWQMSGQIQNPDRQLRSLERVMRTWVATDPAALNSAITAVRSQDLKEKLQQMVAAFGK